MALASGSCCWAVVVAAAAVAARAGGAAGTLAAAAASPVRAGAALATARAREAPVSHRPPRYRVDLDLPARERWGGVLSDALGRLGTRPFLEYYNAVLAGLQEQYPKDLAFYRAHLAEFQRAYADLLPDALEEVYALADALRARAETDEERQRFSRGEVFLVQLHMQMGNIGVPAHGECTSVVVRRPSGAVAHFRNWDFGPLPDALGLASVEVDFVFGSTGRQGFRCLLALTHMDKWTTCMKPGTFSMSLNARTFGRGHERGRAPSEELALLQEGRRPRVAVLREVMLAESYEAALTAASSTHALSSMYVILAGPAQVGAVAQGGRGAVVTLSGNGSSADVLPLPGPEEGWFLVQTNVDHWLPMSDERPSSHRREHVKALLQGLGEGAPLESLYKVLQDQGVFPPGHEGPDDGRVFRPSTVASVLMLPEAHAAAGAQAENASWATDVWRPRVRTSWGGAAAPNAKAVWLWM
mmetsp:Transcript_109396/g.353170  ORF Transcript_109396/g.353170 Transcript_109396/m.353170 type:complete len:471 (+) Transcript_109396:80-1492(+)